MRNVHQKADEIPETPTYLDTKEFAEYTKRLGDVIEKSKKPLSIGDQKRALKSKFDVRWHQDALDALVAIAAVESFGWPTKYRSIERRPVKVFTAAEKRNYWVSRSFPVRV